MRKETIGGNINWVGSGPRLARMASALVVVVERAARLLIAGTRLKNTKAVMTSDNISFTSTHQ